MPRNPPSAVTLVVLSFALTTSAIIGLRPTSPPLAAAGAR
jgi:hypothetical protein